MTNSNRKKNFRLYKIVLIGVLAAMVFALSSVSIPIGQVSRIHLGNIMCLLSGLVFGPLAGGMSSGLGSMLYDLTNPAYAPEFWITFVIKFALGAVAGLLRTTVFKKLSILPQFLFSAFVGSAFYIALYISKSAIMQYFFLGTPWVAIVPIITSQAIISFVNAMIAVLGVVMVGPPVEKALKSTGFYQHFV